MSSVNMNFEIPEELIKEITERVLKEVRKEYSPAPAEPDEVLSVIEVGKLFGLKKDSAYKFVEKNNVPYRQVGRRKQYLKSEVMDWYKKHKYFEVSTFDGIKA